MVRAKISISDFHILNTLIYLTPGLFKTREKGEEGMGGGRGKGARVLMTFSLWNLVSIVSAVSILPKDSTCHHGHTVSELLNSHRWYYTHAHADDLILVRLRCFFSRNMPMSANDLLLTNASLGYTFQDVIWATFMPTTRLCQSLPWVPVPPHSSWSSWPFRVHTGTSAFLRESELFTMVSRDSKHMVSHPREWKNLHFSCSQFLPTYFMASFRAWGAKQTERNIWLEWGGRNRDTEMDLQCSVCRKRGMGESQQGVKGRVQVCVYMWAPFWRCYLF